MTKIMIIMISSILVDNYVLSKIMGICPFLGVSKKLDSAFGMSCAVTFVMVMATLATWPINQYMLVPNKLDYLQTLVFILVIAALVQLVEMILKKYIPVLHRSLGVYLPLITTNCAVLGVTLVNIQNSYTFVESIFSAVGAGLGFMLAMVMFAGVRERLETADIPAAFQGMPITLIAASIVSVSFMGFGGIVENIFK